MMVGKELEESVRNMYKKFVKGLVYASMYVCMYVCTSEDLLLQMISLFNVLMH